MNYSEAVGTEALVFISKATVQPQLHVYGSGVVVANHNISRLRLDTPEIGA
jgi:hypothetical protein